jgi:chemotaxis receptor (MCP) glutamine deamidase CheD
MSALAFHDSHVIQGEQAVSDREDATLQTVLGSCVAACLHDPGQAHRRHEPLPAAR